MMFTCFVRRAAPSNSRKRGRQPFVGVYFARTLDELFKMVDEVTDPGDCEYAMIHPPFGFHVDDGEICFTDELSIVMGDDGTGKDLNWVSVDTLLRPISAPGHA
jgi:hypothetical protein